MPDEVAKGEFAEMARRCVGPFRASFPDFRMEIADLVAECEKVAAHFRCSRTHLGEWIAHPPTGSAPSGTAGSPGLEQALAEVMLALEEQELADSARLRLAAGRRGVRSRA